jgi:hypothetical protein
LEGRETGEVRGVAEIRETAEVRGVAEIRETAERRPNAGRLMRIRKTEKKGAATECISYPGIETEFTVYPGIASILIVFVS